jgi:hypothetical protein
MIDNGQLTQGANLFELKTDSKLEENGIWVKWTDSPTEFLIASFRTSHYRSVSLKESRKRGLLQRRKLDDVESLMEVQIETMAKVVLLGWRGDVILDQNEGPVAYSYKNAVRALSIRAFRDWVEEIAGNDEKYQEGLVAADMAALKSGAGMDAEIPEKLRVP